MSETASPLSPVALADAGFSRTEDGWTLPVPEAGRQVLYCRADPLFATGLGDDVLVTVEYLDNAEGGLYLEFVPVDATPVDDGAWRRSERVGLAATGQWRSAVFAIHRPRLTGVESGADFRLVVERAAPGAFSVRQLAIGSARQGPASRLRDPLANCAPGRFVFPGRFGSLDFSFAGPPQASIVIPVFNRLEYTLLCLRALLEFTPPIYELIVVNNGSTDATRETLAAIPGLKLINSPDNEGFARACNCGAEQAQSAWLVLLNNDTLPQPGWLTALIACAGRLPGIGAVGSKLVFPQTGEVQSAGATFGQYLLPEEAFKYLPVDDPRVTCDRQVRALTGACMLLPTAVFRALGGFDTHYRNGLEDSDLCLRLGQAGYRLYYCAASEVLHFASATAGRYDDASSRANLAYFRQQWAAFLGQDAQAPGQYLLRPGELPYRYSVSSVPVRRMTGRLEGDAITCTAAVDTAGHCAFGPAFRFTEPCTLRARFSLQLPEPPRGDAVLATIDAYDSLGEQILAIRDLQAADLRDGSCDLQVDVAPGQVVEFRLYWHAHCDLHFFGVELASAGTSAGTSGGGRWIIRDAGSEDRPQLLHLFSRAFGQNCSEALWDWKYAGGRGAASVATRNGQVVAHYGGTRRDVLSFGEPASFMQCTDTMVDPRERGVLSRKGAYFQVARAFLEKHVGRERPFAAAFGFPNARVMRLGELVGVQAAVDEIVEAVWGVGERSDFIHRPCDPSRSADRRTIERLWRGMARDFRQSVIGVRDPEYLAYRYLRNPQYAYELLLVQTRRLRRVEGLVVLRREGKLMWLMDLVAPVEKFPLLVGHARFLAGAAGCGELRAWVSESHARLLAGAAERLERPGIRVPTCVITEGIPPAELDQRWWLTTGDAEFK